MKNLDEDYAYEQWRQKKADETTDEVVALHVLRNEVVRMSHCEETCYQHGFLCTALSSVIGKISERQLRFLQKRVRDARNGRPVIPINIEGDFHLNYVDDEVMFAAMDHAYRLGILDQWITDQRGNENG